MVGWAGDRARGGKIGKEKRERESKVRHGDEGRSESEVGGIVETTGVGYQLVGLPGFSAREGEAKGFTSGGGFAARETHPHPHSSAADPRH